MESITFFDPRLYSTVNTIIVFILCVAAYFVYSRLDNDTLLHTNTPNIALVKVYMWIFIIVVGLRPINNIFGDMKTYTWSFEGLLYEPSLFSAMETTKEWIWAGYCYLVGKFGGVHLIFFTTTLGYVLFSYLAISRLFKYRRDIVLLFLFGFFSFFAYATNTIRSGLAMSIVLLSIAYLVNDRERKLINIITGGLLILIAFGIHRSSLLTIGSIILAATVLRNIKLCIILWILCLVLSFVLGSGIQDFITNLIMSTDFQDDRVMSYIGQKARADVFLRVGFRWDFILFSSLPILVGIYVSNKIKTKDRAYNLLLNTYIIANMFWVLVNRAAFSDRIAYLSWFLYPIVVAYPFLKMDIKPDQSSIMSKLLLVVSGFTLFMNLVYYD